MKISPIKVSGRSFTKTASFNGHNASRNRNNLWGFNLLETSGLFFHIITELGITEAINLQKKKVAEE